MAVTKGFRARRMERAIAIALILIFLESTSLAESHAELDGNLLFQSGYGGKQVYDGTGNQQLSVYEPVLFADTQVSPSTTIGLRGMLDVWSGASDHAFDAGTGASRAGTTSTVRNRGAADLGVSTKLWETTWSANAGFSTSTSYRSLHGGIGAEKGFAEDNFTVGANYDHFDDSEGTVKPSTRRIGIWNPRITDSTFLGASQILGPSDIVYVGGGYTSQRGLLSTTGNTVSQNGMRVDERLPSSRNKGIFVARYVHGLSDYAAAHADYRFYVDDWGISAHTVELSLALEPDDDASVARFFYRYHTQTGTRYYADAFQTPVTYMTSDSDLAPLDSNELGVQGILGLGDLELGGALVYYVRSNDLQFYVIQASGAVKF